MDADRIMKLIADGIAKLQEAGANPAMPSRWQEELDRICSDAQDVYDCVKDAAEDGRHGNAT